MGRREREQQRQIREILQGGGDSGVFDPPEPEPTPEPTRYRGLGVLVVVLLFTAVVLALILVWYLPNMDSLGDVGGLLGGGTTAAEAVPLPETADAGQAYLDETLFLGDSNTVRYAHFGLVGSAQVKALEGIGVSGAMNTAFTDTMSGQSVSRTMVRAVRELQPKRILVMLGTNDIGSVDTDTFAATYAELAAELRAAAPNAALVIAGIPPVDEDIVHQRLSADGVRQYNQALMKMCREQEVAYLDTTEALSDDGLNARPTATEYDGMHLSQSALEGLLAYYRTHAWQP